MFEHVLDDDDPRDRGRKCGENHSKGLGPAGQTSDGNDIFRSFGKGVDGGIGRDEMLREKNFVEATALTFSMCSTSSFSKLPSRAPLGFPAKSTASISKAAKVVSALAWVSELTMTTGAAWPP
jgi:hypothetical protein